MRAFPDPALLSLFDTGLSQHARLLTLASSQQSGLPQSLVAEGFAGRETVNALLRFEAEALIDNSSLNPGGHAAAQYAMLPPILDVVDRRASCKHNIIIRPLAFPHQFCDLYLEPPGQYE